MGTKLTHEWQLEIMGDAFSAVEGGNKVFTYRYNTANPTSGSSPVEHAAENWMMFLGTNIGCAPVPRRRLSPPCLL